MDNTEIINVLSFCTGYAGIELGLSRVFENTLRCIAVEIEAFAVCNLVAKAEEGKLGIEAVYSDIKKFPAKEFRGCFNIITAGYPCQPFSHAGKRKGSTDPRHLWPFIRDHIGEIRPLLVICENVAGHLSLGFDRVVSDLEDLGYTVEAGIYAAAEVGAPHRRERLFIVAYRECDGFSRFLRQAGCRQDRAQQRTNPDGQGAGDGTNGPALAVADGQHGRVHTSRRFGHTETRSAGEKLVDAECTEPRVGVEDIEKETRSRGHRPPDTGSAVSDSERVRCDTGSKRARWQEGADTDRSGKGSGLADSDGSGCKEQRRAESVREEHATAQCSGRQRWPARPGQPQYEWEEPRTVKPGMGRTIDGFASRVDELRLLGNGVVPLQFEMALRDILRKIENEKQENRVSG